MQVAEQAYPLLYKDALKRTECESIDKTVRSRKLLRSGALLRIGAKRVVSGELENAGKREPEGQGKEWTDGVADDRWRLASRGSGVPPHLTLGSGIAQYAKWAAGLWPRG